MKKYILTITKIVFLLLILFYIFQGTHILEIWHKIKQYNTFGIIETLTVVLLGDFLVAYRLYILCEKKCSLKASMEATMFSLVANSFMPAKIGELSKVYYLNKKENIKKRRSFIILIMERFSDIISLSTLLLLSSALYFSNSLFYIISLSIIVISIIFILLIKFYSFKIINKIRYKKIKITLYLSIKELKNHFSTIKLLKILLISLIVWSIYIITNIIFFKFATYINIDFKILFSVSMIAFAAAALPLTPGGIGTFQIAFIFILAPYGISKETLIASTFILQFLYIFPSIIYILYVVYLKKGIYHVFAK